MHCGEVGRGLGLLPWAAGQLCMLKGSYNASMSLLRATRQAPQSYLTWW